MTSIIFRSINDRKIQNSKFCRISCDCSTIFLLLKERAQIEKSCLLFFRQIIFIDILCVESNERNAINKQQNQFIVVSKVLKILHFHGLMHVCNTEKTIR